MIHADVAPPRRKRRVFVWVFAAVQVLFIAWMVIAVTTKPGGPSVASQTAHVCAHGGWRPLFKSHADCMKHYAVGLNDAADTGKGIGVALGLALWVAADFLMAVSYGIYRLARKP